MKADKQKCLNNQARKKIKQGKDKTEFLSYCIILLFASEV